MWQGKISPVEWKRKEKGFSRILSGFKGPSIHLSEGHIPIFALEFWVGLFNKVKNEQKKQRK